MKLLWTAKHQAGLYVYLLIKGNVHVHITYMKWDKMLTATQVEFHIGLHQFCGGSDIEWLQMKCICVQISMTY